MNSSRFQPSAIRLMSGLVLVFGGMNENNDPVATSELSLANVTGMPRSGRRAREQIRLAWKASSRRSNGSSSRRTRTRQARRSHCTATGSAGGRRRREPNSPEQSRTRTPCCSGTSTVGSTTLARRASRHPFLEILPLPQRRKYCQRRYRHQALARRWGIRTGTCSARCRTGNWGVGRRWPDKLSCRRLRQPHDLRRPLRPHLRRCQPNHRSHRLFRPSRPRCRSRQLFLQRRW
jgi:hypothetical protein